ncbi:MAG: hypothetical protein GY841_01745 [FCB group bacterium]|nr:hypothetical protein [FCB group bacterium]
MDGTWGDTACFLYHPWAWLPALLLQRRCQPYIFGRPVKKRFAEILKDRGTSRTLLEERVGAAVVRGPDWHWNNQDGGEVGHSISRAGLGWAKVIWVNGTSKSYRTKPTAHDLAQNSEAESSSRHRAIDWCCFLWRALLKTLEEVNRRCSLNPRLPGSVRASRPKYIGWRDQSRHNTNQSRHNPDMQHHTNQSRETLTGFTKETVPPRGPFPNLSCILPIYGHIYHIYLIYCSYIAHIWTYISHISHILPIYGHIYHIYISYIAHIWIYISHISHILPIY